MPQCPRYNMFLFEACLVYISWIMQMRIIMHQFWNHVSDLHSLKQNIRVSSVTSKRLETFMLLGPNCAYHMMDAPYTQVYCTFKFIRLLFVEVTNHFIRWHYHNTIKKWPFKKTNVTQTTPLQHLAPLQNIHATQWLTSYCIKGIRLKALQIQTKKKNEFKRNIRCKYGVIHFVWSLGKPCRDEQRNVGEQSGTRSELFRYRMQSIHLGGRQLTDIDEIWIMYASEVGLMLVFLTKKKPHIAFCGIRAHLWLKTALCSIKKLLSSH